MPKIIQLIADHTVGTRKAGWLAVCDDGHVWRYHQVEKPAQEALFKHPTEVVQARRLRDPEYIWIWDLATEFEELQKEWT